MKKGERRGVSNLLVDFAEDRPWLADRAAGIGKYVNSSRFRDAVGFVEESAGMLSAGLVVVVAMSPSEARIFAPILFEGAARLVGDGEKRSVQAQLDKFFSGIDR